MNCSIWKTIRGPCNGKQCCEDTIKSQDENYNLWCDSSMNNQTLFHVVDASVVQFLIALTTIESTMSVKIWSELLLNTVFGIKAITNYGSDVEVGKQFVEFINRLVPAELDMSISTAWNNINGQMEENDDFFLKDLFSSPFFNKEECLLNSNDSNNDCQQLKSSTKKLITEGKYFLSTLLSVAKQPVPKQTSPEDYSMIKFCDFINGTIQPMTKNCDKFQQAKTNPYRSNCLTFNGDDKQQLFNPLIGPMNGLNFVIDYLRPGTNVKQAVGKLLLHETGSTPDITHYKNPFTVLLPGVENAFNIRPFIEDTTENFDEMKPVSQKCQNKENGSESVNYDQLTCLNNNAISNGLKLCQCYPWYLPQEKVGNLSICDAFGMKCFQKTTESTNDSMFSQCPDQCKVTKYYISLSNLRSTISGMKDVF
jgi:hypothetical protein